MCCTCGGSSKWISLKYRTKQNIVLCVELSVKQSFLIQFLCRIIYEHAVSIEIYSIFKQAAEMKWNVGWVGDAVGILHVWSDGS